MSSMVKPLNASKAFDSVDAFKSHPTMMSNADHYLLIDGVLCSLTHSSIGTESFRLVQEEN